MIQGHTVTHTHGARTHRETETIDNLFISLRTHSIDDTDTHIETDTELSLIPIYHTQINH